MKSWWMLGIVLIGVFVVGQSQSSAPAESKREGTMVKYFSKEDLTAAFAKGATLSEQSNYKVIAAGRSDAGTPEAHKNFTDIFYIVQGETTLVTGGRFVNITSTDPDEPRATSIEGGETRELSPGDSIVIPAGVPHWMKEVRGTLHYYVIKVRNPQ